MNAVESNQAPAVSVVIPCYDSAKVIARCLDSVFSQTYSDFEVIVVNDGSPDTESLELALKPYLSHVRYFKQENGGPSSARNRGITEARSEYVAFLDSDDFWFPEHLASQVSILCGNPSLGLVYGDSLLMRGNTLLGYTFDREQQSSPVTFETLLQEHCTVTTSSTVASRQAMLKAGLFDEQFRHCEDFDLWLRMAFQGTAMAHHPGRHVCRSRSDSGLSSDDLLMKLGRMEVLKKIESQLPLSQAQKDMLTERYRQIEALAQLDMAREFIRAGEMEKAFDSAKRAASVLDNWRLRLAVIGLHRAPRVIRACYRVRERWLTVRNRVRAARSTRKLKASYQTSPVRVEGASGAGKRPVVSR